MSDDVKLDSVTVTAPLRGQGDFHYFVRFRVPIQIAALTHSPDVGSWGTQ